MEKQLETIEVIEYSMAQVDIYEVPVNDAEKLSRLPDVPEGMVRWINIDSAYSYDFIHAIGDAFKIHPLVIENLTQANQRVKIETYDHFLHMILKMIYFSEDQLIVEHLNMILGTRYILTIGDMDGDVFEETRMHIQTEGATVRKFGADYLFYLLFDAVVDGYFTVLEKMDDCIDDLEEAIMTETSQEHLLKIREIKKTLLRLNKNIWPLRDAAAMIEREGDKWITMGVKPYVRDVYNHVIQAIDSVETYRELLSGLVDMHLSNTSNRLNEIMRVLTVISTIFIPLSFIAGVYGMNFKYMPELNAPYGYFATWGIMLGIAGGMLYFFKRKNWF